MNSSNCPSENALLDFAEGRSTEVRAHVMSCEACQDLVGELKRAEGASLVLQKGQAVGRYLVLRALGSGAMGVVYEAYDPELARTVAIKLVRPEGSQASEEERRARLLREGQAMARVTHPHVIAVYDVGRFENQVFIAMEQATGGTLTAWLGARHRTFASNSAPLPDPLPSRGEGTRQRGILELLIEAGRGLEAAHAAGLVHRDFKPDNVLIGADGRARVTDFGLARVDATSGARPNSTLMTRTGASVGTPAYMAPEQLAGQPADVRSDVYSYCVTFFEALTGTRPFEARTVEALEAAITAGTWSEGAKKLSAAHRTVLKKGLAAKADQRFQSMTELLAALDPEPRRRRRVAVTLGASALVLLTAGVFAQRTSSPCAGVSASWRGWDDTSRARVKLAFLSAKVDYANDAFESVARALDTRRDAWARMATESCEATRVHHTQSDALLDRRTACLAERKSETAALVALLEQADLPLVERASDSVGALSSLDDCANPRALGEATAPTGPAVDAVTERIAQARALRAAGRYAAGLETAQQAVTGAEPLDAPRVLASARFIEARCLEELMRYPDAERAYHQVVKLALAAHDDATLADAWMQLSGIAGYRREQLDEAWRWLGYAESASSQLGADTARRARRWEKRSLLEWSLESKLEEADLDYAKSLALEAGLTEAQAGQFQPSHGPVAFDMGRYDVALKLFERDEARIRKEKGAHHPELLEAIENRAEVLALLGRAEEAVPLLEGLINQFPERAEGYTTHRLAEALRRAGRPADALVWDERALAAPESDDANSITWGQPLTGKGLDLLLLGRAAEAIAPLERAAKVRAKLKLEAPKAETDFALARALWESKTDRPRALALAKSAEAGYRAHAARWGSKWLAADADEVARWLGSR